MYFLNTQTKEKKLHYSLFNMNFRDNDKNFFVVRFVVKEEKKTIIMHFMQQVVPMVVPFVNHREPEIGINMYNLDYPNLMLLELQYILLPAH